MDANLWKQQKIEREIKGVYSNSYMILNITHL